MSERKIVTVKLRTVSIYMFDRATADEIILRMEEFKAKYGKDIYFQVESGYNQVESGYNDDMELCLYENRLENDKEYNKRLAQEEREREAAKKAKVAKLDAERREYERLRKKFGGK